jgi:putative ABC transport system permease protein
MDIVDPPARGTVSVWRMATRQLARDFRAGELRLLLVAVSLAVAALTAVGFFADRIHGGLTRDATQLLGGDAVVVSDRPTPQAVIDKARSLGLASAATAVFPSMGRASDAQGGATRLVTVKAVSASYPLRGRLSLSAGVGQPPESVAHAPEPGTAWVESPVLDALALMLGDASLRVTRVILIEPDRGAGFMSFSPRVLINEADLDSTGLIQPASRVTYRLIVAANPAEGARGAAAAVAFKDWVASQLKSTALSGVRLDTLETGRPEMRQTLDRAEKFLNLVALLAAVAVGIASRDFASRHLDDCAMLRVLGLAQRTIALQYLIEFGLVGALASALGVALGFGVHHVFVWLLSGLVAVGLPAASWWPALLGVGVGLTLLTGFGLPPVLQLARVPPLRVIRRDVGALQPASIAVLLAGVLGFSALLLAVSSDVKLGLIAVGGFAGAIALFALLSAAAVWLLRRAVPESNAPRWLVLATRQIAARPAFAVLQVSALSVGLLALVLLVLLRTDLIDSWRQATPPDAPNRFVINVQPEQAEAFQAHLRAAGVARFDWYPMIRGRLLAINGNAVSVDSVKGERAKRLVEREFNLSYTSELPSHNELTAGRWVSNEPGALSVESGLAETLGLKLGDTMAFDMAGQPVQARISSVRKVDWGSMHVNFFVLFPGAQLEGVPNTFIAAFQAPPAAAEFDNALVRQFPNLTNVDVSASIAQIQSVLDQVISAVEFLFVFTLAAGLVVLFAAVTATREARSREFAVMRALGASGKLLAQVQRAELLGVGALAGVLASGAASVIGWVLASQVFDFAWQPSPLVPLLGGVAGALLSLAAGWWGLREVLRRPVIETLRQAAQ